MNIYILRHQFISLFTHGSYENRFVLYKIKYNSLYLLASNSNALNI